MAAKRDPQTEWQKEVQARLRRYRKARGKPWTWDLVRETYPHLPIPAGVQDIQQLSGEQLVGLTDALLLSCLIPEAIAVDLRLGDFWSFVESWCPASFTGDPQLHTFEQQ
jgi:hypothetical protein